MAEVIREVFSIRNDSNYDDAISKERVEEQIGNAQAFYNIVGKHLRKKDDT